MFSSCSTAHTNTVGCDVFFFTSSSTIRIGVIKQQFFWGSPGFGETPDIDRRDSVYVVEFQDGINVYPTKETIRNGEPADTVFCIKQIQIISRTDSQIKNYVGKNVVIKGVLSHAISGNHHTDAVIEVSEISR